jgi:mRNA interferase MazF
VVADTIVRRGSVWWIDFDPTRGAEIQKTRPAIVLSADAVNRARRTIMVVPLSTGPTPRPPIIVSVPSAGQDAVAICDQMRAVDRSRFVRQAIDLSGEDLRAVENGVRSVLQL